jgi:uncharacterized lipoprotein YddW (UPF0748 family)
VSVFERVRRLGRVALVAASLVGICGASAPVQSSCGEVPMRGMWISTVSNIDWPSRPGSSVAQQQREYRALLDMAVARGLDAVMVQVRPTADAFWPSPYEPWSQWLTGAQGQDPGYDPLAFLVEEAHARKLELHAWFNPFRVSTQADPTRLVPDHPARRHPEWVFTYAGKLYYNPGIPEVRAFVQNAILDAVNRYEVDGVHLDDYFYPYPERGERIPDAATFAAYGGGFANVEDWRRDNINQLVRELGQRVDAVRPAADFGISPFGIWRNRADDPLGSDTSGSTSYDTTYADTRRWVTEGWVDYIAPQIYWEIGHSVADYAALVPWWADVVGGTDVELYIGQAAYKVGTTPAWDDGELAEHVAFNAEHPQVRGDIYFSANSLSTNAAAAMDRVVARYADC